MKYILMLLSVLSIQAAVYEPLVLWNKLDVSVCFYKERTHLEDTELRNLTRAKKKYNIVPGALNIQEQSRITRFVQDSFSAQTTGISFFGFKNCKSPVQADVVVMTNSPFSLQGGRKKKSFGRASIGEAGVISYRGRGFFKKKPGFYGTTGEKAYVYLAELDKTTAVHEFGHIAGLRHEHARDEAFKDSQCTQIQGYSHRGNPLKENLYITTESPFSYDSKSVMNYCYINPKRKQINAGALEVMSDLDRKTLKLMYE